MPGHGAPGRKPLPSPGHPPHVHLTLGHSPDADDLAMVAALAEGLAGTDLAFDLVALSIDRLNARAAGAEKDLLDVTALSAAGYARVHGRYRLLPSGWSVGRGYGPVVVAGQGEGVTRKGLGGRRVAVPGLGTTAHWTAHLAFGPFDAVEVPFDAVEAAVRKGRAQAGILIHEAQLTAEREGLHPVVDLGAWWQNETGLPLVLGVNAVRRGLPDEVQREAARAFRASVRWAMEHPKEALRTAAALSEAGALRLDRADLERYLTMYANEDSLDAAPDALQALSTFYARCRDAGLLDGPVPLDPVEVPG